MSARGVHEAAAGASLALLPQVAHERGWFATVVYYAAVQKVEARLADRNEHPRFPDERLTAALSISPKVGPPWRKLKQLSEDWRYGGHVPAPTECDEAQRWASDIAAAMDEPWPL